MTPPLAVTLAQGGTSVGGGFSILLFQIVAIGLVFYFLIIRPQAQARRKHQEMLSQLKRGDEVLTAGGLVGRVRDIKEIELDGGAKEVRVTVESGTSSVVIERSRIVRIGTTTAPGAPAA